MFRRTASPSFHETAASASPVFVCGTARSGTTLVTRLLDGHPELAVFPGETWIHYDLLLERLLSWFVILLAEMLDRPLLPGILLRSPFRWFAFAGRDRLRARLELWSRSFDEAGIASEVIAGVIPGRTTHEDYWRAFLKLYDLLRPGALTSSRYWVEKTPSSERFIGLQERTFRATARYIHIIRDPRDVVASWFLRRRELPPERDRTLVRICYLWSLSVHRCARGLHTYPARYHGMRYEDLVERTKDVMHRVCRFLDIEADNRVFTATKWGEPVSSNSSYAGPDSVFEVTTSQIGRYRDAISPSEICFIEDLLHGQMAACGYLTRQSQADVPQFPAIPAGARGSWKSRAQIARAWKFQREYTGKSLALDSLRMSGSVRLPVS